jgi:hypothetical protein
MFSSRPVISWSLIALCVALFSMDAIWHPPPFELQLGVKGERSSRLRLFYDTGKGIRPQDSNVQWIDASAEFTTVRFRIDAPRLKGLRLTQVDSAIPLELRSLTLHRFPVEKIRVDPFDLKPAEGIATITQISSVTRIIPTSAAGGATIAIQFPEEFVESRLSAGLRAGAVALLGLAAVAFLWWGRSTSGQRSEPETQPAPRISGRTAIISFLTAAYLLTSVFELNQSSSAIWRYFADWETPGQSLLAGSPKDIRGDEWGTETPWMLAQSKHVPPFSLANPNIGEDKVPLLTNLPVRHWSMLFRPQLLGFFFLNFERAFAFYWNFKWFGLLLAAYLFFEILSGGKTLIALAGALFILFSPYIQWWFSTPAAMPEMMAMLFFALWSILFILRTRSPWRIAGAGLLLFVALGQFVFCCYPRFQIPLFYLGAVVVGSVLVDRAREKFLPIRVAVLGGALLLTGVIAWVWYRDVAGLIHQLSGFAYPGQILSVGGFYPWWALLAPFLEFSMNEEHWPSGFMNVCEAAGFLFIAPLLLAAVIDDIARRRFDAILLSVATFVFLVVVFMIWGIPLWLAKGSGWAYVYSTRAHLVVGVGSTIGLVRYLSRSDPNPRQRSFALELLLLGIIAVALWAIFGVVNRRLGEFASPTNIAAAALFFGLVFVCLWTRKAAPALALLLLPTLLANGLTNPIGRGLPGFEQSELRRWLSEHEHLDPTAKWIVLGRSGRGRSMPEFVKTTGADVLGGVRITPDREMVRVLDPENKYADVYNRFAWITCVPGSDPAPVFKLTFLNSYDIQLPLRTDIFDQLGVRYILTVDLPVEETTVPGFQVIGERANCRLWRREKR